MTDNLVPIMEGTIHLIDAGRAARRNAFHAYLCKYVRRTTLQRHGPLLCVRVHCAAEAAFRPPTGQNNAGKKCRMARAHAHRTKK